MHLFVVDACFRWKCLSQVITSFSVIDEHVGELVDGGGKNDNLSSVGVYWCCNDLLSVGSMLEKDVWMLCVCVQVWVLVCVKERLRQSVCCWIFSRLALWDPEGRPGMYDGPLPPVWNLRTVFWFPFPMSCFSAYFLLLFLSCHFSAGTFFWHFLSKKLKYFSLRVRRFLFVFWYGSCWEARRWQLVDSMCSLLPFGTGIYHYALYNFF